MSCAVILTALPVEYLAVRFYLTELHEEIHLKGTIYERGQFTSISQIWDVGIVEIGAGNTGAAIEAERAITYFSPDVLFFVGVAGGIKDVEIGDVVASTKIYGFESGKAEQRFKPRPEIGLPAYGLEQRARAEARKGDWLQRLTTEIEPTPRAFVAPIAAGEKVVASTKSDVFQFLAENYGDAIAVEMEGLGFLEAARANQRVEAIVIRGISDLIDGKGKADKAGSQEMASRHASAFAFTMLANLKLSDEGGRGVVEAASQEPMVQKNVGNAKGWQTVVQGGTAYIGEIHIHEGTAQNPPPANSFGLPKSAQEKNLDLAAPKVFISYSHGSQEHKDRILELADRLREDGIDCMIDQYEESPSEGWQRWMLNQVEEATFVLVACTEQYDRRFRGREVVGKGKGVTWEGGVIIQELYDDQGQNAKFIPVTLAPEDTNFIPSPLRSATSYRLNTANGYELLYRRLTNQPKTSKPALGIVQQLPHRDRQQFFLDENRQNSLKNELLNSSKGLLDWKRTLGDNQQITRPELKQLVDRIETETSSTTIVLGSPGCGKSALMATLGHWAVEENYVLLAIKADYLGNAVKTLEDLRQDINLSWNIRDAVKAITSTDKVILLIDQLDALAEMLDRQSDRLNILLSLIQSLAGTRNVHIVATCREFEFRHGTQFNRLESFERLDLSLPTWENIVPFLEAKQHTPSVMGEPLRELLRTPLHLGIFLEIAKPGDEFESLPRLLDRLWKLRVLDRPQAQELIEFLTKLADRMTKDEVLWVPSAIADENPEICRVLEKAGILMTNLENSTIGFCHQTFYDHTLARAFARGSKSLIELVLDRQDGIFVRPILLRSLSYLRGTDSSQYQQQLQTLLTPSDHTIRPHIRTLLLEFVGSQAEPNTTEASLLIPLLNSETEGIKVLAVMAGSPGWFRRLRDRHEFTQWLEKPVEQAVYCCPLLTIAVSFATEDVWKLLEEYWLHEQAYDVLSLRATHNIEQLTHEQVDQIRQIIQRSNIDWWTVSEIAERISKTLPGDAAKVIRAHLDRQLGIAITASQSPPPELSPDATEMQQYMYSYEHGSNNPFKNLLQSENGFYNIEKFAQMNPKAFLDSIWPWFINILNLFAREADANYTRYRENHLISLNQTRSKIVGALSTAVLELAQQNRQVFLEFVTQNLQSDLLLVHRLLARGLEKIANQESQNILNYLLGDQRRLHLGDYIDGPHCETKKLISSSCPYLSSGDRKKLENAIYQFDYYQSLKNYPPAARFDRLKCNRQYRLRLLLSFPDEYLSPKARKIRDEEIRAFPQVASEYCYPTVTEFQTIGLRMTKDEMSRASEQDLLNLMNKIPDEAEWGLSQRNRRIPISRFGNSVQQSREFGKLVQDNPDFFLHLLPKLQARRHEMYAGAALLSLSETNFSASQLLQILEELDRRGFSSEDFYNDAANALEKVAKRNHGLPTFFLNLLKSWLLVHSRPELEYYRSQENRQNELQSPIFFDMGGSHVLPDGRGDIVRALANGYLQQNPPDLTNWSSFIRSQLGVEQHPAVWVDILLRMPPLLNGDPAEATELFDEVIRNCPEVLQYSWALNFIAYEISRFKPKETVQGWLEILQENGSSFSQQAYGELLLIQYLQCQDEWSSARIRSHLTTHDNDAILCGLAHAASFLWGQRRCRMIATEILYILASSGNRAIQLAVASVFLRSQDNFRLDEEMLKIIQAICKNQDILLTAAQDLTKIIESKNLVENHPKVVVEFCISLVSMEKKLSDPERATQPIAESLTTIAIQLHRQTPYREVGLEIFEQLLAFNLRETVLALETLDRKPRQLAR
jgi:nucleoside phosphorylase